jgi:ABC-type bacteriocin/lantibiotic exporter with double-glycine peptidase domain
MKHKLNKPAFIESVTDTMLGFCINFPLSWLVLFVMLYFTQSALLISIVQVVLLTIVAIIRRYLTRIYFERKGLHKQSTQKTFK